MYLALWKGKLILRHNGEILGKRSTKNRKFGRKILIAGRRFEKKVGFI